MKRMSPYILPIVFLLLLPLTLQAEVTWEEIKSQVDVSYDVTINNANQMEQKIRQEKKTILSKRKKMEQSFQSLQRDLTNLKQQYENLQKEGQDLASEIKSEKRTIQAIKDSMYSAAQRTNTIIQNSPITGEHPQRSEDIQPLLDKRIFPGMHGVKIIMDTLWEEITQSSEIAKYQAEIIGQTGSTQLAEIGRIGSLCSLYEIDNTEDVGYLRVEDGGERYAFQGKPGWSKLKTIQDFMQGKSQSVPIDVSGGTVFKFLNKQKDFGDWVRAGGILIWPIFALAAFALIIMIERFFYLMWMQSKSNKTIHKVSQLIGKEKWHECKEICEKNSQSPICYMVLSMMNHWGVQQEIMENVIHESLLRFVPKMERLLPTLGILGAIAPLLGLLGTVTGIINTFQIITMFGTGDPKLMSGGISEALVTTQVGLAVAIPIMLVHHYFKRKVDKIIGKIEEKGNDFALRMMSGGAVQEKEQEGVA
jgi:biopolymer transport protein ExbB